MKMPRPVKDPTVSLLATMMLLASATAAAAQPPVPIPLASDVPGTWAWDASAYTAILWGERHDERTFLYLEKDNPKTGRMEFQILWDPLSGLLKPPTASSAETNSATENARVKYNAYSFPIMTAEKYKLAEHHISFGPRCSDNFATYFTLQNPNDEPVRKFYFIEILPAPRRMRFAPCIEGALAIPVDVHQIVDAPTVSVAPLSDGTFIAWPSYRVERSGSFAIRIDKDGLAHATANGRFHLVDAEPIISAVEEIHDPRERHRRVLSILARQGIKIRGVRNPP